MLKLYKVTDEALRTSALLVYSFRAPPSRGTIKSSFHFFLDWNHLIAYFKIIFFSCDCNLRDGLFIPVSKCGVRRQAAQARGGWINFANHDIRFERNDLHQMVLQIRGDYHSLAYSSGGWKAANLKKRQKHTKVVITSYVSFKTYCFLSDECRLLSSKLERRLIIPANLDSQKTQAEPPPARRIAQPPPPWLLLRKTPVDCI